VCFQEAQFAQTTAQSAALQTLVQGDKDMVNILLPQRKPEIVSDKQLSKFCEQSFIP
jgi:hypothetical protein